MAIKIGSNIASTQAQRRLGEATSSLSKIYERLSSGMRINKASDDAAGLSVASKLKADSRVFGQAILNLNDGISAVTIATSAIDSLKTIVTRQNELATQAANGSYTSAQRTALNNEARQLTDEYNRIVATSKFNGRTLFASNAGEMRIQAGYGTADSLAVNFGSNLSYAGQLIAESTQFTFQAPSSITPGSSFNLSSPSTDYYVWFRVDGAGSDPLTAGRTGVQVNLNTVAAPGTPETTGLHLYGDEVGGPDSYLGAVDFYVADGLGGETSYHLWFNDGVVQTSDPGGAGIGIMATITAASTTADIVTAINSAFALNSVAATFVPPSLDLSEAGYIQNNNAGDVTDSSGTGYFGASGFFTRSQGTNNVLRDATYTASQVATALNSVGAFSITNGGSSLTVTNLGGGSATNASNSGSGTVVNLLTNGGFAATGILPSLSYLDLTTAAAARTALTSVATTLNELNLETGSLGAYQSRLNIALENVRSSRLMIDGAYSRITDADIAQESAALIKQQILQQASVAILASANQQPNLAMQLLKNIK